MSRICTPKLGRPVTVASSQNETKNFSYAKLRRSALHQYLLLESLLLCSRIPVQGLGDAVYPVLAASPLRQNIGERVS